MTAAAYATTHCNAAGTAASRSASCCANSAACRFSAMDTACAVSIFVFVVLLALGVMECVSVLLAGLIVRLCGIIMVRLCRLFTTASPE